MTRDTWHVWGGVNILSKFQLPSSYRLWFMILWRSGGKGWIAEWRGSQLNECSRQCSRPVLARCSMGFGPNPLINGLILHTFKLNKFFSRKIHSNTFWLDKTFIFSSQVTMMFQKKRFFKNKKIRVRFSIVDFPAKPAKQKKQVALKKSLRLHTRGTPAAAAEWVN